jgi:hypothetical protein
MNIAIGPSYKWPSWKWCAEDLIPDLQKHHHVEIFNQYNELEKKHFDLLVCMKFPPPASLSLTTNKIIYFPIDHFKKVSDIDNHSNFLQKCNIVAVHCDRLSKYLNPYCRHIEFVEHYSKYALSNPTKYNPSGIVLWIGVYTYVPSLKEWYDRKPRTLKIVGLSNHLKKINSHHGISIRTWTEDLQQKYFEKAKAGLDIKGDAFIRLIKPPTKAQQFIASGIPTAVDRESYSWEYFHKQGLDLADPDDEERWFSQSYWKETHDFVPKLRELTSKDNVVKKYLQLIEYMS